MTSRPPYRLDPSEPLPTALGGALTTRGLSPAPVGMSFWTDAAILAGAGIPSVLFGPGGAGLHSIEEYVNLEDVDVCRAVIVETVRRLISSSLQNVLSSSGTSAFGSQQAYTHQLQ